MMDLVDAWLAKMGLTNCVNTDQRETLESFGLFVGSGAPGADDAVPAGWKFYTADFSVNAKDSRYPGHVMLIRDQSGVEWWHRLGAEDQERVDLYVSGKGSTVSQALHDACARAASAPKQKT